MSRHRLCSIDEIANGAARGFRLIEGGRQLALFVVNRGGTLRAYRNRCPHAGSPLDWRPDQFFDANGRFLLCATHGALFVPEDGLCIDGPCVGQRLELLAIDIDGDDLYLEAPAN